MNSIKQLKWAEFCIQFQVSTERTCFFTLFGKPRGKEMGLVWKKDKQLPIHHDDYRYRDYDDWHGDFSMHTTLLVLRMVCIWWVVLLQLLIFKTLISEDCQSNWPGNLVKKHGLGIPTIGINLIWCHSGGERRTLIRMLILGPFVRPDSAKHALQNQKGLFSYLSPGPGEAFWRQPWLGWLLSLPTVGGKSGVLLRPNPNIKNVGSIFWLLLLLW